MGAVSGDQSAKRGRSAEGHLRLLHSAPTSSCIPSISLRMTWIVGSLDNIWLSFGGLSASLQSAASFGGLSASFESAASFEPAASFGGLSASLYLQPPSSLQPPLGVSQPPLASTPAFRQALQMETSRDLGLPKISLLLSIFGSPPGFRSLPFGTQPSLAAPDPNDPEEASIA